MKIPGKDDLITVADAVDIIAKSAYPDDYARDKDGRKKARDRVYEQIRDAYRKGVFGKKPYRSTNQIRAVDLFTWACGQKNLQKLTTKKGLPRYVDARAGIARAEAHASAFGIAVPATFDELLDQYQETLKKLSECEAYIRRIRPELDELAEFRREKARISAERSKAGSKHGKRLKK